MGIVNEVAVMIDDHMADTAWRWARGEVIPVPYVFALTPDKTNAAFCKPVLESKFPFLRRVGNFEKVRDIRKRKIEN